MDLGFDGPVERGLQLYVRLVAQACGLGPHSFIDWDPPMRAYLPVDGRLPGLPGRDVALWWQEETGWAVGIELHAGEDLVPVRYLGAELLAEPAQVAAFLRDMLAGKRPGQPVPPKPQPVRPRLTRLTTAAAVLPGSAR